MRLVRERALASRRWMSKSLGNFYEFVKFESCLHRLDTAARRVTYEYERVMNQIERGVQLSSEVLDMDEHVNTLMSMIDGSGDEIFGCDLLELTYENGAMQPFVGTKSVRIRGDRDALRQVFALVTRVLTMALVCQGIH